MSEQEQRPDDRHGIDADPDFAETAGEPSLEGIMGDLARGLDFGDGWQGIESGGAGMAQQRREMEARAKREANVFRDTFSTEPGRKCLELMLDMTLRKRAYPPELNLAVDAITPLIIAHDAQCNFVWAILAAIAQADNRTMNPRD